MEDKKITEKESLELISEMLRKTKEGAAMKQDYNAFLFYGYTAAAVSLAAWLLIHFTDEMKFMFVWFAMFLPYLWTTFSGKRKKPEVTTYIDGMLGNIWKVIGSMFGLTLIAMLLIGIVGTKEIDFSLMMPLAIIYGGIGTSMTGLVIKEKWFIWPPLVGLVAAVYMLMDGSCDNLWNFLFGLSFLAFMAIPAHIVSIAAFAVAACDNIPAAFCRRSRLQLSQGKDAGDFRQPQRTDRQAVRSRLHRSVQGDCRQEAPYLMPPYRKRARSIGTVCFHPETISRGNVLTKGGRKQ